MITQRQSDSDSIDDVAINQQPKDQVKQVVIDAEKSTNCITQEQYYRSSMYKVLAGLLRTAPDQDTLVQVAEFSTIEQQIDEFALAMSMLGLAARTTRVDAVDDEFHALFIGLGRGELMPYASWYLTGFLMERPLSVLRDDLVELGFERSDNVHEPEDHIAALCEVMAMMIDEGFDLHQQNKFFSGHMSSWMDRFFIDLSKAEAAVFYRSVGRFGQAFSAFEKQYLAMSV